MQKGLFSSLPSISNWPARVDLAVASGHAAEMRLVRPGDFAAVLSPETGPMLSVHAASTDAREVTEGSEGAPPLLAALAGALPKPCCLILARPPRATVLAALAESQLPPICAESALFHRRHAVDPDFGGRPPGEEGARLATLVTPETRAVVLANHGLLLVGARTADAVQSLVLFERAAGTYLEALATGRPLRIMPEEIVTDLPAPDADDFFATIRAAQEAGSA